MSQQPSTFGQPTGPSVPPSTPEASGSRRTVVLAVAGAVVALGVLGGVASLVLTGDDGATTSAPLPAAASSPEPSVEPSVAPTTPLPTVAVQGRNIFVPLVGVPVAEEAAAADGAAADGAAAAESSADTSSGESSGSGGATSGIPLGTVSSQNRFPVQSSPELVALQQRLDAQDLEIASLRSSVSSLDAITETVEQAEKARTETEVRLAEVQAKLDGLVFVSVLSIAADGTLVLDINGTQGPLDGDPETDTSDVVSLQPDDPDSVTLQYVSVDDASDPRTVKVRVGSTVYTVSTGATLTFQL